MSAPTSAGSSAQVDLGGRSPWSVLLPLLLGFFMIMVDKRRCWTQLHLSTSPDPEPMLSES